MTSGGLAEWLLTQIDDDQAAAQAALGTAAFQAQTGRWIYEQVPHPPSGTTIPIIFALADRGGKTQVANMEAAWEPDERAAHITRWDPARVLAECQMKRKIIALYAVPDPHAADEDCTDCRTLRLLAAPYSGRPGFREEWRTSPE